jgi:hypothetical protein
MGLIRHPIECLVINFGFSYYLLWLAALLKLVILKVIINFNLESPVQTFDAKANENN